MMYSASLVAIMPWFLVSGRVLHELDYQPAVITVESHPARKVFGSLSNARGTPWCDGNPTFWLVGHQGTDETPWCYNGTATRGRHNKDEYVRYSDSDWNQPRIVALDSTDIMNERDGPAMIDRHACKSMDVNNDEIDDIICTVGANKYVLLDECDTPCPDSHSVSSLNRGEGVGYTELYLGTVNNGLRKVESHGLQKFPTMRSRLVEQVRGADGSQLVFIASRGARRRDNHTNVHRMFRNFAPSTTSTASSSFFEVVHGPWQRYTRASCLIVADINGDGLDDILICGERSKTLLFMQHSNSTWTKIPTPSAKVAHWRNARVADMTGDGIPDLLVVGWGASPKSTDSSSYLRLYEGRREFPHFDFFSPPLYQKDFEFATPDLEVLDVDHNGIPDVYVVQSDEVTAGEYCALQFDNRKWWDHDNHPPSEWTPPIDSTRDSLLVGTSTETMFREVHMSHEEPGCGWLVERFGNDQTVILAQGTHNRPGHNLILQW